MQQGKHKPKRGEIWWVNFDPSIGGEIRKKRPAVVVSNDLANAALNRVQVIPLTSTIHKLYPAECLVRTPDAASKAMADQLTTVSTLRLVTKMGQISAQDMEAIEQIIRFQLGLRTYR
jgi:mRNA interferase MazF